MDFFQRLLKSDRRVLLLLICAYLVTHLAVLQFLPFVRDEAIYAVMVQEQADSPSLIPTFFGYPVSWKPAPFFWLYVPFSKLLSGFLPLEAVYRLPSLLFGLATVPPLYRLLRNAGASRALAFCSLLIFTFSYVSLYPQTAMLADSPAFFFICASLWLYTEERLPAWRFIAAGALAFAAFFVKIVLAFMVPVLAVAWFFAGRKETLRDPLFLASLAAVPVALVLHAALLQGAGMLGESYASNVVNHLLSPAGAEGQFGVVLGSLMMFISSCGIWFLLSLFGFWKNWRSQPFMAAWYALLVFPVLTGFFMPWYYLPVMPAVAYFAALAVLKWEGVEKADLFFFAFLSLALAATVVLLCAGYVFTRNDFLPEKEAGLALAGKEGVLIAGDYAPGVFAYKMLTERRELGRSLDFGLVVFPQKTSNGTVAPFLSDYYSASVPVVQGSFSPLFSLNAIFRKDTNITKFGYVALVGNYSVVPPGAEILYNRSPIVIYSPASGLLTK